MIGVPISQITRLLEMGTSVDHEVGTSVDYVQPFFVSGRAGWLIFLAADKGFMSSSIW